VPATHTHSERLAREAEQHLPGGVNSPVRAFRAVGGNPVVFQSASGSRLTDVDGNSYVDFIGSWGPAIVGHAHPDVIGAVQAAAAHGLSFGATNPHEIELAKQIKSFFPSMEMLRLVSSGTEACMSAIRVARGFTGKPGIIKFEGCYHGHSDCLLAKAGSGAMTLALPDSAGIPPSVTQHTYTVPFNDLEAVEKLLAAKPEEIGTIILEPVAGNMGLIPPATGFLEGLRSLADRRKLVLIFDEVMTGFRLSRGGAQERFQIKPDMTVLGKVVGGGMPLAAYGGRREIMEQVAPLGSVYQAGTLSGNPVAVAAGSTTLKLIDSQPDFYDHLEAIGGQLQQGLQEIVGDKGRVQRVGSMWTLFFTSQPVTDFPTAKTCDTARFAAFFRGMLEAGFYLPPSQFEAAFLSAAHTTEDIEAFLNAARKVLAQLA
jgi:glutamate-1-semialdehyde 2,1-aminomutase